MYDRNRGENWVLLNHVRYRLYIQSDVLLLSFKILALNVWPSPRPGPAAWEACSGEVSPADLWHRSSCVDPLPKKLKNVQVVVVGFFEKCWYGGGLSHYGGSIV